MKCMKMVFFIFAILLHLSQYSQTPEKTSETAKAPLKSRIIEVTVFPRHALIKRTASVELTAGEHQLKFAILPADTLRDSIQIGGQGNFSLRDIIVKNTFVQAVPDEKINQIKKKIDELKAGIEQLNDKLVRNEQEKKLIEKIINKATAVKEKDGSPEINPDQWIKLVQFYRSKGEELDAERRNTSKGRTEIQDELQKWEKELSEIGDRKDQWRPEVEVKVDVKKAGSIRLELTYMVQGPSWRPVYELRVSGQKKAMTVIYQAMVSQNTTEDWTNVRFSLSTAKPFVSSQHPELDPWFIRFLPQRPAAPQLSRKVVSKETMQNVYEAKQQVQMFEAAQTGAGAPEEAPPPAMEMESAGSQVSVTAETFVLPGEVTILSDNREHKVGITIQEFPAHFRYSTVPKLVPKAYLKAKVTNTSPYTILPGQANVFLDQNFVSATTMNRAARDESFWTFLGVDEEIKVEYKLLNRSQGDKGVINKKNTLLYESQIILTNNKKSEEEVVVWDQIPISSHEDIKVKLLEPEYKQDSESLKMNKSNILEWFFHLKPGDKVEIPFKFSIEYPADKRVTIQ